MQQVAPGRNRGFTLTELLIVTAVIAVTGAIGVALFAPAFRTSEFGKAVDTLLSDIEIRQRRAVTTGREVTYSPQSELLRDPLVLVNANIRPPSGFEVTDELRFQAATGKPLGPGHTVEASTVILSTAGENGSPIDIVAVCINRSGIITTLRYSDGTWSPS